MVRRETDFSCLQRSVFNWPVFWLAVSRGCVRGYIQSDNGLYSDVIFWLTWSCATCRLLSRCRSLRKMNMWESMNASLAKLGFNEIQEKQQKVVEANLCRWVVLMVAPTGSGKSLTFLVVPFVLDFYKHGEWNLVDTAQFASLFSP